MRDEQRQDRENQDEDIDERFDDALDDLFGEDEDDPTSGSPAPAGAETTDEPLPDPEPAVPVPPESLDVAATVSPIEQAPPDHPPIMAAPGVPHAHGLEFATPPEEKRRDYRKIACFGCLFLVGIPALCFAALIAWGLASGTDDSEPTAFGRFVDDAVSTGTATLTTRETERSGTATSSGGETSTSAGRTPASGQETAGNFEELVQTGELAPLGNGWDLRIDQVTEDANQIVADANMFNDPPLDGRQFLIASVTATNNTGASATFDASFVLRLIGTVTGGEYTTFEQTDRCGVIPDPFPENEIPPGASATGNVCWQVPIDDLPSLILFYEDYDEDSEKTLFVVTDSSDGASNTP